MKSIFCSIVQSTLLSAGLVDFQKKAICLFELGKSKFSDFWKAIVNQGIHGGNMGDLFRDCSSALETEGTCCLEKIRNRWSPRIPAARLRGHYPHSCQDAKARARKNIKQKCWPPSKPEQRALDVKDRRVSKSCCCSC